jgi:hypothetical protein
MLRIILIIVFGLNFQFLFAQAIGIVKGTVSSNGQALPFATVGLKNTTYGASTNSKGYFEIKNIPVGAYEVIASAIGFEKQV